MVSSRARKASGTSKKEMDIKAGSSPSARALSPRSYPLTVWRLVIDGQADGPTNMAVDAAILEAVTAGASLPTLRFYAWSPPCLSLGRNQPLADVDMGACRAAGVDVVRRPTGGRAILHTDELTYSVALLQKDPRATGDVVESYRRLSEGLLAGLGNLSVEADQATRSLGPATEPSPVCFEMSSRYEITVNGRKLVGSAQWRARGGVLQHGTLPLEGDIARIVDLLAFPASEREVQRQALLTRAATLEWVSGQVVPFAHVAQALADGFARTLELDLRPGALSSQERARAEEYRRCRYSAWDWIART